MITNVTGVHVATRLTGGAHRSGLPGLRAALPLSKGQVCFSLKIVILYIIKAGLTNRLVSFLACLLDLRDGRLDQHIKFISKLFFFKN